MPTFSFQNPLPDLAFAKPKALRLGSATYETPAWAKVLEEAARAMLDGARTRKAALAAAKRFSWMGGSDRGMARPCELEPGVWLELHQGSHGILVRTKMLLEECGYPLNRASLEYEETPREEAKTKGGEASSSRAPEKTYTTSAKSAKPGKDATKARPKSGVGRSVEGVGAFAKRMLTKALSNGLVPESDFFKLLDSKPGETGAFRLSGHPLFSRSMITTDGNNRTYSEPIQTRFGFPVYLNSQWRDNHRTKLDALLAKWGVEDDAPVSPPPTFVQQTLPGLPEPKRSPRAGRKDKSKRKIGVQEKIGAYAKRMLFQALAEKGRIPDEDFTSLQSMEGTKALLGISLTTCPLFSLSPMVRRDGGRGSWIDPATHDGRPVYVNSQWYEEYRPKLDRLLARWPKKGSDDPVTNNDDEWIPLVLEVAFPNGFQPGNFIDAQRFKAAWQRELKEPWPYQSDAAFDRAVRAASVSAEGRLFAPASLLPEDIAKKLARDILSRFANGARSVRFPPLFNEWKDRLEGSRVYDPAALRAVVKWLLRDRKELVFKGLAVTNDPDWFDNPIPEVERVLDEHGTLMSVDELCRELPDFSEDDLVHACRDSSSIILAKPRHYIAVSAISFDTEADRATRDWLDREFRRAVHVPVRALAEAVRSASPSFADTTDGFTTDAYSMFFRSAIGDAFDVTSFVVARKGEGADIRDVAKSWLAEKDAFNLDDFLSLVDSFGAMAALYPQMAAFFVDFIRIDASHFVRKDGLRFPVADIDRVLAGATADGGLPISDENVRHLLPPAPDHLTWTPWLLADYADKVSTGFRFLSGSTSQREALGAIVPAASPFRRYEDILPGILARALTVNLADARGSILWLYENGWIPQRRFRDIDRVLGVARSLRAQKKGSL